MFNRSVTCLIELQIVVFPLADSPLIPTKIRFSGWWINLFANLEIKSGLIDWNIGFSRFLSYSKIWLNLPNLFAPNHSVGKIIDDYSQDVEIFDSVKEIIDLNTVNLYDVLKNNKSQDFIGWNGSAYIKSGTTDYYGDDTGEYVKHSSATLYTNRGKVVNAIGEDISEFRN